MLQETITKIDNYPIIKDNLHYKKSNNKKVKFKNNPLLISNKGNYKLKITVL